VKAAQNINIRIARALGSDKRVRILRWLKDPRRHFPPQLDGDLVRDGVCGVRIAEKLGIRQPTASEHLRILLDAGLLRSKKIRQWIFYQRDAAGIRRARRTMSETL
jgi:DNA-binding transcriptional ArsR family regulator